MENLSREQSVPRRDSFFFDNFCCCVVLWVSFIVYFSLHDDNICITDKIYIYFVSLCRSESENHCYMSAICHVRMINTSRCNIICNERGVHFYHLYPVFGGRVGEILPELGLWMDIS